jgi:hypothetical protein
VRDTKLFETILGIQARWRISRVTLDTSAERIDLWTEHASDTRCRLHAAPPRLGIIEELTPTQSSPRLVRCR